MRSSWLYFATRSERAGAPVIGWQRRAYYWRTAAIGLCCTAVAVTVQGHGPRWLTAIILLPELFETPYFCIEQDARHLHLATSVGENRAVRHFAALAR